MSSFTFNTYNIVVNQPNNGSTGYGNNRAPNNGPNGYVNNTGRPMTSREIEFAKRQQGNAIQVNSGEFWKKKTTNELDALRHNVNYFRSLITNTDLCSAWHQQAQCTILRVEMFLQSGNVYCEKANEEQCENMRQIVVLGARLSHTR
jgi:hypothetical protein